MPKLPRVLAFLLASGVTCGTCSVSAQPAADPPGNGGDAKRVATPTARPIATDSLGDPLPEGARLRLGTLRFHASSNVDDMALSPDGKTLITAGRRLIAWDTATGKQLWTPAGGEFDYDSPSAAYGTRSLAFPAGGTHFFTPSGRDDVAVWEIASGRREVLTIPPREKVLGPDDRAARSVDVTPDGTRLAVGGRHGVVVCDRRGTVLCEIANAARGQLQVDNNDRLTFGGHYSLGRFSPDGKTLAVVTSDRPTEVRLHDPETGRESRSIGLKSRLVRMAFSPDGKTLATTERDGAVRLYDLATGDRAWSHVVRLTNPYENYTSAVAFSPDGTALAVCATDNRIYLIDPATGAESGRLNGHRWYPWALAFTPDGKTLYSSGWEGVVRRWDVPARTQLPLPAGVRATSVVTASPDGRLLAYADDSGTIRLVEAAGAAERRVLALPGTEYTQYTQLSFSPDSRILAGGGSSGDQVHVAVWEVEGGRLLHRWDWPKGKDPHSDVESLGFTPDGSRLAAAVFRQSAAYLWDVATGRQVARLAHKSVYGLSFTPDGKTLVTAGWDSIVRFWETDTGAMRREVKVTDIIKDGDLRMYTVCCAPEGGLIATAHLDGTVHVWTAGEMRPCGRFRLARRFSYGAMRFSPDGLWLATGLSDGEVEVWDPYSGRRVWDVGRHQDSVYTLDFGRGIRALVSGGEDGVGYLWDLRPPGTPSDGSSNRLWHDLTGEDGPKAYRALWTLAGTPDRAVALVAERLDPALLVVDMVHIAAGKTEADLQRQRRIRALLGKDDSKVIRATGVRRAVALLELVDTPEAVALLQTLAARAPESVAGRSAAAALGRLRLAGKP